MLRRASQLFRGTSVLERAEISLMLDRPMCGLGKGESVARTFSFIRGVSSAVVGEATRLRSFEVCRVVSVGVGLTWSSAKTW